MTFGIKRLDIEIVKLLTTDEISRYSDLLHDTSYNSVYELNIYISYIESKYKRAKY